MLQGQLDALLEGARRVTGPGTVLDGVALAGEVRRQRSADGTVSVVTHSGAALGAVGTQAGVRVEPLSLEDLFIEVTQ
jgi:ABC-2 type transport system ATP-binding protein